MKIVLCEELHKLSALCVQLCCSFLRSLLYKLWCDMKSYACNTASVLCMQYCERLQNFDCTWAYFRVLMSMQSW